MYFFFFWASGPFYNMGWVEAWTTGWLGFRTDVLRVSVEKDFCYGVEAKSKFGYRGVTFADWELWKLDMQS